MNIDIYKGEEKIVGGKRYVNYCFVLYNAVGFRKTELILYKMDGATIEYAKWRLCPYYGSDAVCGELEEGNYALEVVQFDEPCSYRDEYVLEVDWPTVIVATTNVNIWICQNRWFGHNCNRSNADIATMLARGGKIKLTPNLYRVGIDIEATTTPRVVIKRGDQVVMSTITGKFPYNADLSKPLVELPITMPIISLETAISVAPAMARLIFYGMGIAMGFKYSHPVAPMMAMTMALVGDRMVDVLFRRV